jgi:hypothetical protein
VSTVLFSGFVTTLVGAAASESDRTGPPVKEWQRPLFQPKRSAFDKEVASLFRSVARRIHSHHAHLCVAPLQGNCYVTDAGHKRVVRVDRLTGARL